MASKQCPNCNRKVGKTSKFCPQCAAPLDGPGDAAPEPEAPLLTGKTLDAMLAGDALADTAFTGPPDGPPEPEEAGAEATPGPKPGPEPELPGLTEGPRGAEARSHPSPDELRPTSRLCVRAVNGLSAGETRALGDTPVVVGSASSADLQVKGDALMSRRHGQFTMRGNTAFVEDLDSTNGTLIAVKNRPHNLGPGDCVVLGNTVLQVLEGGTNGH